jgi:hypothetical protein
LESNAFNVPSNGYNVISNGYDVGNPGTQGRQCASLHAVSAKGENGCGVEE